MSRRLDETIENRHTNECREDEHRERVFQDVKISISRFFFDILRIWLCKERKRVKKDDKNALTNDDIEKEE